MKDSSDLPPFYIGQKVVYITGKYMPKDSVHTVKEIIKGKCGCWRIVISNIKEKDNGSDFWLCSSCGFISKRSASGFEKWAAKSFRPLQQQNFPLIKLTQIKEQELCAN